MVSNDVYTEGLEKAVFPEHSVKVKIPTRFAEAMNLEYSKEWLNAMELELEIIRVNEVAVLIPVSNITRKKRHEYKMSFMVKILLALG